MKAVILAGGLGTRLSEETDLVPKPLVEIGGRPILWHVMKSYAAAGITDFVICTGYKASMIKRYFASYFLELNDIEIHTATREIHYLTPKSLENWTIKIIDTGLETMTGGRIKRVAPHLDRTFCLTYGDGVTDLDIGSVIAFHKEHGRLATVTTVPSPGRFGILNMGDNDSVLRFHEKPNAEMGWINGGYFVLEPGVVDYIMGDETIWERQPLERLAADGQLMAFRHLGFWKAMDTLRDKRELEELWISGSPPWKRW